MLGMQHAGHVPHACMQTTCVLQDIRCSCGRPGCCCYSVFIAGVQKCTTTTRGLHGDLTRHCARHDDHAHVVGILGRDLKCIPARRLALHLDCPTAVLQLRCQGPLLAAAVTAAAWEGRNALELNWVLAETIGWLCWCADSN